MKPVRILHILNGLGSGGTESFIMSIYRKIDRNKIQFDFLIRTKENNILKEEIEKLGGRIYITSDFPREIIKNYKELERFFVEHKEYEIIHVHANSLLYVKPLLIAKNHNIKTRIIHSHNTQTANNYFYKFIHNWNKKFIATKATHFFACSSLAGDWMFNNKYQIINNAIDLKKFSYNKNSRIRIREEFSLDNKFVIGNIARFTEQKNHLFLLDIFNEVLKKNSNAVLMLVGSGKLIKRVEEKVVDLGIQNNVIFTGERNDVPDILSAIDIFLLPSLFEGLGIVLIEAQNNGLKCFASKNVIPKEAKVTKLMNFISLEKNAAYWAEKIFEESKNLERKNMSNEIKNAGFDIIDISGKLEEFYIKQTTMI